MIIKQQNGLKYCIFDIFGKFHDIVHTVTTKSQPDSSDPFTISLKQNPSLGLKNRRRVCQSLGVDPQRLVVSRQVHGNSVAVVWERDAGRGALTAESALSGKDGMITNVPNLPLMVLAADCALLGFYDPNKRVIALIHAGWRGTVAEMAFKTVKKMNAEFECEAKDIVVGIAPSIGPCCYQVGEDVIKQAKNFSWGEDCLIPKPNGVFFDLREANVQQLKLAGVQEHNIECSKACTACHHDTFFSYRAAKKHAGLFGYLLMMKPDLIK